MSLIATAPAMIGLWRAGRGIPRWVAGIADGARDAAAGGVRAARRQPGTIAFLSLRGARLSAFRRFEIRAPLAFATCSDAVQH